MASKKRERMRLYDRDGVMVVDLGEMEIWDGADLALLRETLTLLMDTENRPSVGIEMQYVKYIPSGFFGMLCDWYEKGHRMCLYSPQPNVGRMLWFRTFFKHVGNDCFDLTFEKHNGEKPDGPLDWATQPIDTHDDTEEQEWHNNIQPIPMVDVDEPEGEMLVEDDIDEPSIA